MDFDTKLDEWMQQMQIEREYTHENYVNEHKFGFYRELVDFFLNSYMRKLNLNLINEIISERTAFNVTFWHAYELTTVF